MLYLKKIGTIKYFTVAKTVSVCLVLLIFSGILFISCNQFSSNNSTSKSYQKVIDSAEHIYDSGKLLTAVNYLSSETAKYTNLDLLQKFEYFNFNCNYYFHAVKDNNESMAYADSMLNLFNTPEKKLKYMSKYSSAFFYKGDILFEEKKYNEAYHYYYQGMLMASKSLNDCTISDYSYRMGMITYKQEHYRLAASNFQNSSKETESCDFTFRSFYRRQELLNNTGLSYSKINEADSAMMFYDKALAYINTNAFRFKVRQDLIDVARGVVYGNKADLYIKQNNFSIAKRLLKKSSEINLRKGNDNLDAQLSEMKLAHIYFQTYELDSLYNLLNVVKKQLDTVKNQAAEADWNFMMASYLIKKNKPETALDFYIKYDALKDSVDLKNKALKDADITQQIRQLEKDHEVVNLKKDNQVQDLYLRVAAIFGVMLLIIIFLIFFTWQRSRKNIKILGGLNHQINNQNASLEKALNELKLSSHEKDRILRTVAHDLRNPIGGIASLTLAMADDDYNDEQKEMINLIRETSNNSLELINEILEITNTGISQSNKELIEINSLLAKSVELLRFKAAEKRQEIKLELLSAPKELLISREKIWRVISNLISNAIKFSPAGAVIFVAITDFEKDVQISVKDNGIGIPENIRNKVFNTFTEAKRPGTAGEKSFGLGLSISKQIIENHNGKIWFENNENANGTTFYVRLPKLLMDR
ncbi:ATP-binding protein [Mucilaginibacter sp.]|uniref:ATP-binding protein n=1 Tax=Mucilaginibacter sp. TaxID=1882438 RepID=UPI003D105ACE